MRFGYAHPELGDAPLAQQVALLRKAGCKKVVTKLQKTDHRQGRLSAALDRMREGDTLVVWRLDCLAPSLKQLCRAASALERRGLGLKSLTEGIDTTRPGGEHVFHTLRVIDEFDRKIRSGRIRAGISKARLSGRICGRPQALSTSDVQTARQLLADLPRADVARRLGCAMSTLYRHIPARMMWDAETSARKRRT